jgi:hypothetical protein
MQENPPGNSAPRLRRQVSNTVSETIHETVIKKAQCKRLHAYLEAN